MGKDSDTDTDAKTDIKQNSVKGKEGDVHVNVGEGDSGDNDS